MTLLEGAPPPPSCCQRRMRTSLFTQPAPPTAWAPPRRPPPLSLPPHARPGGAAGPGQGKVQDREKIHLFRVCRQISGMIIIVKPKFKSQSPDPDAKIT